MIDTDWTGGVYADSKWWRNVAASCRYGDSLYQSSFMILLSKFAKALVSAMKIIAVHLHMLKIDMHIAIFQQFM